MKVIKVILEPRKGDNLAQCYINAVVYSGQNNVNVEFTFEEEVYYVIFNDLLSIPNKRELPYTD